MSEPSEVYGKEKTNQDEFIIPEFLQDIVGCIDIDFDPVEDREKMREIRYAKYLK